MDRSPSNSFKFLMREQPDERFFSLPLVKIVTTIFMFFLIISLSVVLNEIIDYQFSPTVKGMNFFVLDILKVPSGLFAFYLAVMGLIASNHRSEQVKVQINQSRSQNDFANYYKHLEEFEKYIEKCSHCSLSKNNIYDLHKLLFPESRKQGFNLDARKLKLADDYVISFSKLLLTFIESNELSQDYLAECRELDLGINYSFHVFNLSESQNIWSNKLPFNDTLQKTNIIWGFFDHYIFHFRVIDYIFRFDTDYKRPIFLEKIIEFNGHKSSHDNLVGLDNKKLDEYKKLAVEISSM